MDRGGEAGGPGGEQAPRRWNAIGGAQGAAAEGREGPPPIGATASTASDFNFSSSSSLTAPVDDDHDAPEFTLEQINECKDLFSMFDKDGGGSIDRDEFGGMMKTLGLRLTDRELDEFFFEMDVNNNGGIEFDELLTMLRKISQKLTPDQEFQEAFKFFDLDNSGSITGKEMHRVLTSMGEKITMAEAEAMIRAATSGNSEVTPETFKEFCLGANLQGQTHRRGSFSRPKGYSLMMEDVRRESGSVPLGMAGSAGSPSQPSPIVRPSRPAMGGKVGGGSVTSQHGSGPSSRIRGGV